MIRVTDMNAVEISINDRLASWDAGRGPTIIELSESSIPTPPGVNNGILLETSVYFLMLEDGTNYLLQEA